MSGQFDLFSYPRSPGFKARGTSQEAARVAVGDASILRERAFAAIAAAEERGLTADECATALDRNILSVRPRLSELRAASRIVPSGSRRQNLSCRSAIAWKVAR
jgi:hypothetical protein